MAVMDDYVSKQSFCIVTFESLAEFDCIVFEVVVADWFYVGRNLLLDFGYGKL